MEKKNVKIKINSKDLKLITEIKVFYHDHYIPDFCNYDLNKHPSEWKWVESPFDREKDMKNFGDNSIYRYKDQFIQKIPCCITAIPDYIDEKNNYYNVFDLLNDRLFRYFNHIPLGFLKEKSEHGKRN